VVFIDEADALLASRGSDGRGGRPNHRDTINQFLLEWDGMNESGVFLMVATNRPFDLDDAVLRRLPRRVLVDLPTKPDREAILSIHLKDETIAPDLDIAHLAEQTPYYSGSDLKNLAVSAALTAVKDELDAKNKADAEGVEHAYPEKRVLTKAHFEKAMGEIGASVSGDMSSLRQIKKFDEQYGDRKGRRKKNPYGFLRVEEREEDARVRA
jgi:SpoVK/Ycf46/Vps4 family AAA+-type ATPase